MKRLSQFASSFAHERDLPNYQTRVPRFRRACSEDRPPPSIEASTRKLEDAARDRCFVRMKSQSRQHLTRRFFVDCQREPAGSPTGFDEAAVVAGEVLDRPETASCSSLR